MGGDCKGGCGGWDCSNVLGGIIGLGVVGLSPSLRCSFGHQGEGEDHFLFIGVIGGFIDAEIGFGLEKPLC